jgi:hypothetical protein
VQDQLQIVRFRICKHDELHPRQGFVVVQFVLLGPVTEKARRLSLGSNRSAWTNLLSSPPSLREIFRRE